MFTCLKRKWQCQIYFQKILPIPSVQIWYYLPSNCILSKVMDDFSFRLIFFKKIVGIKRIWTVMNLEMIRRKKLIDSASADWWRQCRVRHTRSTREMRSMTRVWRGYVWLEWSGKKIGKIINTFAQSFISWLVGTFFTKLIYTNF